MRLGQNFSQSLADVIAVRAKLKAMFEALAAQQRLMDAERRQVQVVQLSVAVNVEMQRVGLVQGHAPVQYHRDAARGHVIDAAGQCLASRQVQAGTPVDANALLGPCIRVPGRRAQVAFGRGTRCRCSAITKGTERCRASRSEAGRRGRIDHFVFHDASLAGVALMLAQCAAVNTCLTT